VRTSKLGINTSFDVLAFENQVLADSSNVLLQGLAVQNAHRNLNMVMAEEVEKPYLLTDSLGFEAQNTSFEELQNKMVNNNQNLKNQFINYELQELNVRAKNSAYYPVITLNLATTPSVGYIRLFGDEPFSTETSSWSHNGTINLRYDLFQGFNRQRNVEIAEIQRDVVGIQIEQLTLKLQHQLKGVYDLYQTRVKIEKMALQRVVHTKNLWKLGKEKYDMGLITVFTLNDIRTTYEQAVLSYYDRLFELLQSHYDLLRITGGIAQEFKIAENFDPQN
jgi:outer membrane protein